MEEAAKQKRTVTNYLEVTLTGLWQQERPPWQAAPSKKNPEIPAPVCGP